MAKYKVKPVALMTSEADKSGFTYMYFPGVPSLVLWGLEIQPDDVVLF